MVREPILGIDLGTTNSCVAVVEGGKPVVIRNSEGYNTTPSVVAFNNQGERLVGHVAKRQAITNPERTISSVKRLMGTKEKIEIDHRTFTPEQISAIILQKIKKQAQDYLGTRVNKAIITVPAYFDDAQRLATRHAGQIAGLEVVRIINEPTASALTYGLTRADKELNLIVFDFGGGTFDVTILQLAEQILHVRATSGNNRLGGDDFDQRVMDWIATRFQAQWGYDLSGNSVAMQRIKEAAEQAKIELSGRSAAEIQLPFLETVDGVPMHFQESLSINEFNKLTADLVKQLAGPIGVALGDAKMQVNDIDRIILVGGTTRIPAVQDFIRNFFEKDPVKSVNPDEAVALGAAIQAGIISGEIDELLLLDVVPMTMGIEVGGDKIARLFPRNTQIPASTTKTLTTSRDGQRSVHVHVVQGESEAASENKSLARVDVTEIPPAEARAHQLSVTFEIDADGIFSVSAKDAATGEPRPIVMTRTHGLTPEKLAEFASELARQAEKERVAEERTAATISAQSTLQSAQRLLERTADRLPEFKQGVVHECIRDLREAVMNGSTDDIARRADELETIVSELWRLHGGEPSVSSV